MSHPCVHLPVGPVLVTWHTIIAGNPEEGWQSSGPASPRSPFNRQGGQKEETEGEGLLTFTRDAEILPPKPPSEGFFDTEH